MFLVFFPPIFLTWSCTSLIVEECRFVNCSSSLEPNWHEVKTASFAWSIDSWASGYCDVDMHTISFVKTGAALGVRFHPAPQKDIYCILWPTPGIRHAPF